MNISRTRQDIKKLKASRWFIFKLSLIEIKSGRMIFFRDTARLNVLLHIILQ